MKGDPQQVQNAAAHIFTNDFLPDNIIHKDE